MIHTVCPNCEGSNTEAFFEIKQAPIFSVVTVKSEQEALRVPRKDIELAFCNHCGFIYNRRFDTDIDYFTSGYEDQQGFSKTFMNFATELCNELIAKYQLKGKTVLEIGCGKGDFINLLTNLSGGCGIGIDPAYEEGRQNNPNLRFHKEFYTQKHSHITAAMIACRHTWEHIHASLDFLRLIRKSLDNSPDTVVFFEVPQVTRILEIQAFWDIYYEHCSYFSAASAAHAFRKAGFEILDLRYVYGEQYLLIEAKPASKNSGKNSGNNSGKIFAIEEDLDEQKQRIDSFKREIKQLLGEWRQRLTALKSANKKVVVWGGGSKSVGFLTNFSDLNVIEHVVDINPNMTGHFIPGIGKQYRAPQFLKDYQPDAVIIMNGVYREEITQSLHAMGVFPEIYAL
ncbi:MAG: methyltransferase domain-containing protein [Cellvibrionaceae bacterium]|nr:methyltransferase domain-containing protein [Cellvibrionaceae bacterium]